MDTPMGNAYEQQQSRYPSSTSNREPSSISSTSSTQTLLPPPSALYSGSKGPRKLPEPAIQASTAARSPVTFSGPDSRFHPYAASSVSPGSVAGTMAESNDPYASSAISPTHINDSGLGPHKRPYRQRRKDPSCDACRERKVKCDATETTSCSECSSRGVKCQFTKETNRRMSSIKQVQELQLHLNEAKQQIIHLRSLLEGKQDSTRARQSSGRLPSIDRQMVSDGDQRQPPLVNFGQTRRNLLKYSRGIFKVPPSHRHAMATPVIVGDDPKVPPAELVEQLLRVYHDQIQRQAPMIHWPSFIQTWEKIRDAGSFVGVPQIWTGLFFGVLACGTLQPVSSADPDIEGMTFLVRSCRLLNTWTDNLTPDHARCALLISVFLYEQNIRSTAWVWLGTAVRMSQEIGLEIEEGPWSALEIEGRRRTFWSIVSWDRLLALQENKPLQMDIGEDEDGWPMKLDDHWLQPRGKLRPPENVPGFSTVGIVVAVIRFIGQLKLSLKTEMVSRDTLQTYDLYFREIQLQFPEQLQLHSDSYLDPFAVSALMPLLMVRFQLYRHNINLFATPAERSAAVDRCLTVSIDTARYLSRAMRTPPSSPQHPIFGPSLSWQGRLDAMVHNLLSRHLWRCALILCFRGEFSSAIPCINFMKAIGNSRKLNIACGRNLAFFLSQLEQRVSAGAQQQDIEVDLELLAYASGDLQGDQENGFAWSGVTLNVFDAAKASSQPETSSMPPSGTIDGEEFPGSALLSERESSDWGGWEHIEHKIARMTEEQHRRQFGHPSAYAQPLPPPPNLPSQPALQNQHHQMSYHRSTHNDTKRVQLAPIESLTGSAANVTTAAGGTSATPKSDTSPPTGASRISIANII